MPAPYNSSKPLTTAQKIAKATKLAAERQASAYSLLADYKARKASVIKNPKNSPNNTTLHARSNRINSNNRSNNHVGHSSTKKITASTRINSAASAAASAASAARNAASASRNAASASRRASSASRRAKNNPRLPTQRKYMPIKDITASYNKLTTRYRKVVLDMKNQNITTRDKLIKNTDLLKNINSILQMCTNNIKNYINIRGQIKTKKLTNNNRSTKTQLLSKNKETIDTIIKNITPIHAIVSDNIRQLSAELIKS